MLQVQTCILRFETGEIVRGDDAEKASCGREDGQRGQWNVRDIFRYEDSIRHSHRQLEQHRIGRQSDQIILDGN